MRSLSQIVRHAKWHGKKQDSPQTPVSTLRTRNVGWDSRCSSHPTNRPSLRALVAASLQHLEDVEEDLFAVLSRVEHRLEGAGLPALLENAHQIVLGRLHDPPIAGELRRVEKSAR